MTIHVAGLKPDVSIYKNDYDSDLVSPRYGRIIKSTKISFIYPEDLPTKPIQTKPFNISQFREYFYESYILNEEIDESVLSAVQLLEMYCQNIMKATPTTRATQNGNLIQSGIIIKGNEGCGKTWFLNSIIKATSTVGIATHSIIDCAMFQSR
jgi:hypothetical protein